MADKMKKRADGRYQGKIQIATVDGKTKYKYVYGKSPKEVRDKLAALRVDLGAGVDLSADRRLSFWIDRWLARTEQTQEDHWHAQCEARAIFWRDQLGDKDVGKITTADLEDVLLELSRANPRTGKPSAKKTMIEYRNIIMRVYAFILQNRVIMFDPAQYLTVPKGGKKTQRTAITDAQIAAIRSTPHETQLLCLIMIYAGLRLGEAVALTWSDVDLNDRTITVNKAYDFRGCRIKEPKTAAGVRTVPIPEILAAALEAAPRSALLVSPYHGKIWTDGAWDFQLKNYSAVLGFDVKAHSLRHTYCTILFEAGVDVLTAKEFMGHSDVSTTMGIYTHLREQKKIKSAAALNSYLSGADDTKTASKS